jgi:hypothetical protein
VLQIRSKDFARTRPPCPFCFRTEPLVYLPPLQENPSTHLARSPLPLLNRRGHEWFRSRHRASLPHRALRPAILCRRGAEASFLFLDNRQATGPSRLGPLSIGAKKEDRPEGSVPEPARSRSPSSLSRLGREGPDLACSLPGFDMPLLSFFLDNFFLNFL